MSTNKMTAKLQALRESLRDAIGDLDRETNKAIGDLVESLVDTDEDINPDLFTFTILGALTEATADGSPLPPDLGPDCACGHPVAHHGDDGCGTAIATWRAGDDVLETICACEQKWDDVEPVSEEFGKPLGCEKCDRVFTTACQAEAHRMVAHWSEKMV